VEAPSSSLRCHHRYEWRLPLAHLLHAEERVVAIDGRNARLASSQGGHWTGGREPLEGLLEGHAVVVAEHRGPWDAPAKKKRDPNAKKP